MEKPPRCKVMFGQAIRTHRASRNFSLIYRAVTGVCLALLSQATPVLAEETKLPLPRFVTTRSKPINVRIGPGTKYGVAWIYEKAGTPVEIIQEFDTWRKIRDADGSEGWLHQNLLQGKRAGIVAPMGTDQQVALLKDRGDDSDVRAWLGPHFRVDIKQCDGSWCEVVATTHPKTGNPQSYDGYLHQAELWGVYKDEVFD